MPISEAEINDLLLSVTTRDEKVIAASVFGVESVLREVITLIASHPEKLQNIGGPIKAVERVQSSDDALANDLEDQQVFNVEVSVTADRSQAEVEWMGTEPVVMADQEEVIPAVVVIDPVHLQNDSVELEAAASLSAAGTSAGAKSSAPATVYACPHCSKEFVRVFELQRHIVVKHTKEKKFKCNTCGQMFALKMYLNNHMRTKHSSKEEKPYGCRLCDYRCIIKSMLTRHMEIHARDKTFQCSECDMSFSREQLLERHFYKHKEKDLKCDHCDYRTANPYQLTAHTKMHTSNTVYSCTQCDFSANTKTELNKHSLTHSEEVFECSECGLVFKRLNSLKRHQYVHMEKTIVCDICKWRTADPYEYKRHQREHDEGKKHVCEKCGFGFARLFDLKKHMKIHEKVHACKICGSYFANSHELTCHKRRRHAKVDRSAQNGNSEVSAAATSDSSNNEGQIEVPHMTTIAESVESIERSEDSHADDQTQTVIIRSNGEQIILPPGVQLVNENGTPYIPMKEGEENSADHQLLEMASAIIAQVDESTSQIVD